VAQNKIASTLAHTVLDRVKQIKYPALAFENILVTKIKTVSILNDILALFGIYMKSRASNMNIKENESYFL
jgi:hypothetical protein